MNLLIGKVPNRYRVAKVNIRRYEGLYRAVSHNVRMLYTS